MSSQKPGATRNGNPPDHKLRVYTDVTQLIAGPDNPTPLLRVNKTNPSSRFQIYLKLERYNPFGSVKDRIALEMLRGLHQQGRTVVEPSSGNTGIALTGIANALGIPIEIAVPKGIPEEKKVILKFLGANVLEADDALCPLFPSEGARGLVNALVRSPASREKYVSPNQYENELNLLAHYRGTGPEIWRQTEGKIKYFFAGFGTCGTISGVGRYLKEQNPKVKIIGVEPESTNHKLPGMKKITGLSEEFVPKILDRSVIDETVAVSDAAAYGTAAELARKDGILVGPTTGAIMSAALQYADKGRGVAVVISPDDAFKYASFYQEYLGAGKAIKERAFDLCDVICPLSRIKAAEALDELQPGDRIRLVLGDTESLKNVAQEIRSRGLKSSYSQEGENRFVLLVSRE